jgi:hypothetical protein
MSGRTLLVGGLLVVGCGGGSTAKIRLIPNVIAGTQASTAEATGSGLTAQRSGLRVGSPTAMDLKSLKYFVSSIQLCQDVTAMGSGYSNTQGCIQLYQNMDSGSPSYATYDATAAMADTTAGRYVDLMTAEGQATLRKPVTLDVQVAPESDGAAPNANDSDGGASQVGAYRFGLINFYRPIKVTAEFPVLGQPGQYFRTRAVNRVVDTTAPGSTFNSEQVQIGDTLSGPTEETTYMLNNGGALFTFQKPFMVTQADVDAKAEIKVDLVFNPENFGQAYESMGCAGSHDSSICDTANNVVIDMPYVRMNPVPRKSGERTHKETYFMDYDVASKLRIELYYNDGDVEAGVQGVDAAVVYDATATMPNNNVIASNYVSQTGSVRTSDASVTLMDYQHTPNLEGLLRRQSGTVTIHCLFTGALCPTPGGTVTRSYSYGGDTVVSTD